MKMQSELLDTQQQLQALRDSADATAQQEHDTSTASAAGAPDAQHEALRGELAALRAMLMERAGRPPVTSSAGAQTDLQGSVVGDELHRRCACAWEDAPRSPSAVGGDKAPGVGGIGV